ncbi:hypothetical protein ACJX0J_016246, partial [Zea mays]
ERGVFLLILWDLFGKNSLLFLMLHQWISFSGVVEVYEIIDIDKTLVCYLDEPYILGSQAEQVSDETIGYEKYVKLLTGKMVNATSTYLHVMDAIPTTVNKIQHNWKMKKLQIVRARYG